MPTRDHQPGNWNQEIAFPKLTFGELSKEILKDQYDPDLETDTIEQPHAKWETDDLAYTYDLFEIPSDGRTYYQVERHGLTTTEPEIFSYWPDGSNITYRPFRGAPWTQESPNEPFGREFIEHLEQGYARTRHAQARYEEEQRQQARYYNQEFTKLAGHLALGITMNQPRAQELIASIKSDDPLSQANLSHKLFKLAQDTGVDLNFNLFQAAVEEEILPDLPVQPTETWTQPITITPKVRNHRRSWKHKMSDLLFTIDIVTTKFRNHRKK
jgi:hypothetical protein